MFAPACSTQTMGCTSVNNSDPRTAKRRSHQLLFVQTVSLEGSEWTQSVEDELGLIETHTEFYAPDEDNELNLSDTAVGHVDRPALAETVLSLTEVITFAGCLCGEGGEGGGSLTPISAVFDSTTQSGMAVYVSGNGHVDLAQADAYATSKPVGLALEDVAEDGTGTYLTCATVTLEDWTEVIGAEFLSPGSIYFLSNTDPGQLTTTEPSEVGEYVIIMGSALTQTTFNI